MLIQFIKTMLVDMVAKIKNPIFGIKKKSFLERKWFLEITAAVPPIFAAVFAAYKTQTDAALPSWIFWGSCVIVGWLFFACTIKTLIGKRQDEADDEQRSHDGLRAALHVLHSTVAAAGRLEGVDAIRCLRVTFHRVVPPLDDSNHLEQITPYVGGHGNGVGRRFSIRSGITGRAIRDNAVYVMDRESDSFEDYKRQLISDWAYTENDAKGFTSDRFSLMAVPVTSSGGQQVLGVVYLDCSHKNFFATNDVKIAVLTGCAGIARYTGERYV